MATSLSNDPNRNVFSAGGWRPRSLAERKRAEMLLAAPPPVAAAPAGGVDYSQPPPQVNPVQAAGRAIVDYLQPPPPARTGPSAGGTISRGNDAFAVAAGTGYRGAVAMPDLAAARASVEKSRADHGITPEMLMAGPPQLPVDPGAALTSKLVTDYAQLPDASYGGLAGVLDLAGNLTAPPAPRPGDTFTLPGPDGDVPFYFQNPSQVAPVPAPKPVVDYSQPPPVRESGGVRFYQPAPGEGWRPVREEQGEGALSPLVIGSTQQQITTLEQELADHQAKIVAGDKHYGFGNARSRESRASELQAQLDGLRATLRAGGGGRGGESTQSSATPAAAPASTAKKTEPAAKPAATAAPADAKAGAKLYTVRDNQVAFAPGADLLKAAQQAIEDRVIDVAAARQLLERAGYKPKAAPAKQS